MLAVTDPRMPCSAKAKLKKICEVIELPPFSALDSRVASHPDMLLFKLGDKLFVCEEYYKEAKEIIDNIINRTSLELVLTEDRFGNKYPNDIKFNVFILNNTIIGNIENISKEIKKYSAGFGLMTTDVKQGYAKCSTVVLKKAIITADTGIYNAACKLGAKALLVSTGGISLDGYNYGFIGGASGVWDKKIFFCGDITMHTDHSSISEFCTEQGYEIVSLSDEPLYDVGTILFF